MKHAQLLIGLFVVLVVLAVGGTVMTWRHMDQRHTDAETKVHRLCIGAKDAMREDARAFEGSDAGAREEAYARFYEGHAMYHSAESLQYCLDTLPGMPASCELNKDWACLAKLAHQIGDQLP